MKEWQFFVYIMANRSRNIYTGMTNSLLRRVAEHKSGKIEGFTKRYRIHRLVYYESFRYVGNAINREKEIKGWDRARRVALIESVNPTWEDLAADWYKAHRYTPDSSVVAIGQQIPRFARDDKSVGPSAMERSLVRDERS
ncbi:MAG TPA: GIY-YIG nuclease family protein [Terriglobales bacterium]|nr:GIY-YIG nuclease family protein [Terriglobales bacterium]